MESRLYERALTYILRVSMEVPVDGDGDGVTVYVEADVDVVIAILPLGSETPPAQPSRMRRITMGPTWRRKERIGIGCCEPAYRFVRLIERIRHGNRPAVSRLNIVDGTEEDCSGEKTEWVTV